MEIAGIAVTKIAFFAISAISAKNLRPYQLPNIQMLSMLDTKHGGDFEIGLLPRGITKSRSRF